MDKYRYENIEFGGQPLTKDEIDDGWLFCCDWNHMLINKKHPEAKCCSCLAKEVNCP